jgi:hypothetical protein
MAVAILGERRLFLARREPSTELLSRRRVSRRIILLAESHELSNLFSLLL